MFLNKTMFKKMIKHAFNNGGLVVGRIYEGLVISSGYWVTWTHEGYIPNWVKAAVMEYTGELPKLGTIFKAVKNEPIQYEIAENRFYDLPERFRGSHNVFVDTGVTLAENGLRFFQQKDSREIICMPEPYVSVIDLRELEGDNPPMGPVSENIGGNILIWKNENSAYAACKIATSNNKALSVMRSLGEIDFMKEGA